jgi:hypothetical protein
MIIVVVVVTFMQGFYSYIPETVFLGYVVLNVLCFYIGASRSLCAVPNMAGFCSRAFPAGFLGIY